MAGNEGSQDITKEGATGREGDGEQSVTEGKVLLKRQLNLVHVIGLTVGSIIGSGIFISPVGVLKEVNSVGLSLIIWAVCGVVNGLSAYCWAELGTILPRSGGDYTYIKETFGNLPGFLVLYINIFLASDGLNALAFATYVLLPFYMVCDAPDLVLVLVAICSYLLIVLINSTNVKWAANTSVIFTASKLIALVIIIVIGMQHIVEGQVGGLQNAFDGSDFSAGAIALAVYSGDFAFSGWYIIGYIAGELKNPSRNLPLGIFIGLIIVTTVYMLANVAYFAVLTKEEMFLSPAVAVELGRRSHYSLTYIMPLFVASSIFGSLNGSVLGNSRIYQIGADDGLYPRILSMIHYKYLTPLPAVAIVAFVTVFTTLVRDIYFLIRMLGFVYLFIKGGCLVALLVLRKTRPHMPRPVKVPIAIPILVLLITVAQIVLTFYQSPLDSVIALAVGLVGIPFYFLFIYWENKPKGFLNCQDKLTAILQMLFMVVPEEKKRE